MDLAWWIAVIGVPLIGAVFAVDFYIHRNAQSEREKLSAQLEQTKADFFRYQISSAQLYATMATVDGVKRELVNQLSRIEDKLDRIGERNDRRDRN